MRPLELRIRNFRSYFGPDVVFDFRGRRLVGIVGPIGSGKSSILDAISYALYGKTPAVARSTKALIHQRADGAAVALRFTVKDQVWEVVRAMRQRGQSQHALYRLERDEEGAKELEKVTLEGDVNRRIVELLGLEFDAFGRSVLLAQGRFAEFLSAPPRERDNVLKGVFGHERVDAMRELAKERSKVAEAEAEKVAFQVQQLEAHAERLVLARSELVALEQRTTELEKAEPEVKAIEHRRADAAENLERAQRQLRLLDEVADQLPPSDAVESVLVAAEAAAATRREAAVGVADTKRALEEAESVMVDLEKSGERIVLEEAAALAQTIDRRKAAVGEAEERHRRTVDALAAVDQRIEDLTEEAAAAQAALAATTQRLAEAREVEAGARQNLHAAEHADMAATLRSELHAGDTCPVCEQTVATLPAGVEAGSARTAAQALDAAGVAVSAAELEHRKHTEHHGQVTARLAAAGDERAERQSSVAEAAAAAEAAAGELAEASDRLSGILGTDADHREAIAQRKASLDQAGAAVADARKASDAARARHDDAIAAEQRTQQKLSSLRVALAEIVAKLDLAVPAAGESAPELRAAIGELNAAITEERQLHGEAASTLRDALEASATALAEILKSLQLTRSLAEELGAAKARADERSNEIVRLEKELQAGEGLVAERDRFVATRDLMARLATDLTDSRFIRYLLDEERAVLSELGSQHLLRLTSGRYEFDGGGGFDIVDLTAADSVRKSDSLSGGETFLASLGLALALAEMVARTGGRLDAFFLDEGFGSLDPEHLDLAMEGIESLVADDRDRLVVVVSHVPELRHRIEDLIELDRSPTTGDTRVVRA